MPETNHQTYSGISESLFFTLYLRAIESQRPDALIKDDKAMKLVTQLSYDFNRMNLLHLSEENKLVYVLRTRQFDRYAQNFLKRYPDAVVVHIGCGLDTRFKRVDNGRVEWYDLDLPAVIELRHKLIGGEGARHHFLACSVLDRAWLTKVSAHHPSHVLFIAEGVFMYLEGSQVKSLVLTLKEHFPGAELIFDVYSPVHLVRHNLQTSISKLDIRAHWGIWHGHEVERWSDGIRLLGEWGYFECPESRLDRIRWLRRIEELFRTIRIYRFQLGRPTE